MREYKDLEFVCQNCGKTFTRNEKSIIKNRGIEPKFCCLKCSKEYHKKISDVVVKCAYCGKEKTIKQGEYNKSENKIFFCDSSCAAKYNNHKRKRNDKTKNEKYKPVYDTCPICGKNKLATSELCAECYNNRYNNVTLEEVLGDGKYSAHKCSTIRRKARETLTNSNREKVCAYCHNHEFDDILQVHHIRGIMSFPKETTIGEINSEDNLVWLCPNHHKMLEMGLIELNDE